MDCAVISALVGEREKMRAITGRNSMIQIWKLALGLGIMISMLVAANDQPARAHQSCTGLAEWFDEEAISSKGRRAPNFEQARRIKREGVELCATGREGDAVALLVTALHIIGVATADSASPSTAESASAFGQFEALCGKSRIMRAGPTNTNRPRVRQYAPALAVIFFQTVSFDSSNHNVVRPMIQVQWIAP